MKTICFTLSCLALLFGAGSLEASTPMGADEYLVNPWSYEGKTVALNVACVRPTPFQSPLPDVIFYHAMTITTDQKPGGEILIAVPKRKSEQFARYYGMHPNGFNSRILNGTLLLGHHPHPPFYQGMQRPPEGAPDQSGTTGAIETTGTTATTGTATEGNKPARRPNEAGVWFVDYKGLNADWFSTHPDIQIPDGPGGPDNHSGPDGPRNAPPFPPRNGPPRR